MLTAFAAAAQKHSEFLPDGKTRAGFFIGDGAGVGKGRSISGIILDSYARGRRQHIWLSCSADLCRDAERDLRDLGVYVKVIDGPQALDRETKASGLSKDYQEGVLFCTYSSLTSDRSKNRLDQIVAWCGGAEAFEGVLVFDECHRAKHLCVWLIACIGIGAASHFARASHLSQHAWQGGRLDQDCHQRHCAAGCAAARARGVLQRHGRVRDCKHGVPQPAGAVGPRRCIRCG